MILWFIVIVQAALFALQVATYAATGSGTTLGSAVFVGCMMALCFYLAGSQSRHS